MIILDNNEKEIILFCKGQLFDKYPNTGNWANTLKPLFTKIYGWNPDENEIFIKLFNIFLKIQEDFYDNLHQIKDIFNAAFYKRISNDSEYPIERAIHCICGHIGNNRVTDDNGNKRYNLNIK